MKVQVVSWRGYASTMDFIHGMRQTFTGLLVSGDTTLLITSVDGLGLQAARLNEKELEYKVEGEVEVSEEFVRRAEAFAAAKDELGTHAQEFKALVPKGAGTL